MPLASDHQDDVIDSSIEEAARRSACATSRRRVILIACLAVASLGACSEERHAPSGSDSSSVSVSATAGAGAPPIQSTTATATATSAATAPKASADANAATSLAGTWEGTYNAKKGRVEMPPKVKDERREADDGKATAGAGTVSLAISQSGEISGKATGALGDATLRGQVEGDTIRASMFPNDPGAPTAMTGTLMGIIKEGVIAADLRASGPDATVVREATFELKRK